MGADAGPPDSEFLLADQRARWERGDRVPVEHFLQEKPALRDNSDTLLDLIYAEVLLRRQAGDRPELADYLGRFPALAEAIRMQFEVDAALEEGTTEGGRTRSPARRTPSPGTVAQAPPGYEIIEELGRGGMGIVYKARHKALDRLVALKVIRSHEMADPAERARFEAEARAVARLSHPNVVHIYEVGEANGRPFLALEYVAGGSLADALHGPPFAPRPAAALVATLARAVQHAHDAGIVHRDLKPANVLIQKAGVGSSKSGASPQDPTMIEPTVGLGTADLCPKLTDFGLAKHLGSDGLTRTGDFLGTPNYAAPEQAAGRPDVGPAADVYALGAILYHLVTGRPPFAGATALETLDQVRFADPVPPSRLQPSLPKDLGTIILTCLRKESDRRYPSAGSLVEDLRRFLAGQSIRARAVGPAERAVKWARRSPATAALVIVSGLAAAVLVTVLVASDVRLRKKQSETESALQAATEARNDLSTTLERERHTLYLQRIRLAQAALLAHNVHEAERELQACLPEPDQRDLRGWEWHYLNHLCHSEVINFREHGKPVYAVAFSPDGERIASVSPETLKVWDTADGHVRLEVSGPGTYSKCFFSPDGKRVAVADTSRNVFKIYDATDGRELLTLVGSTPTFSPDGRRLAAVDIPLKRVRIYDASNGEELRSFVYPSKAPGSFVFRSDGLWAAVGRADRTIRVWNLETNEPGLSLRGQTAGEFFPIFSPDGRRIASAGEDGTVKLWDTTRGDEVSSFEAHPTGNINYLAFSADGQRFASADFSGSIRVWDHNGQPIQTLPGHGARIHQLAFGPGGRLLASASSDRTVKIWDTDRDPNAVVFRGHPSYVLSLAFSPDSARLASVGFDGAAKVWDPATGQTILDMSAHLGFFCHVRFSPDGKRLFVCNTDTLVKTRDASTGNELHSFQGRTLSREMAVSPSGDYIAAAITGEVKIWNLTSGDLVHTLRGHTGPITKLDFSPNSTQLATASNDKTVKLWDVATGREIHTLHASDDRVYSAAFSSDGTLLATGGNDDAIRVWDTRSGAEVLAIRTPWGVNTIHALAFSPDGRRLASGDIRAAVTLWDTQTGQEVLQFRTRRMIVTTVQFSPDGRRLAAVTNDGAITVWEAPGAAAAENR